MPLPAAATMAALASRLRRRKCRPVILVAPGLFSVLLSAAEAAPPRSAAPPRLPPWAGRVLRGGERVAHVDTCGPNCFLVLAGSPDDSLAGRLVRISRRRGMVAFSEQYTWVASDLACRDGVVPVRLALPPAEARAVLEAVRPHLRAGECVDELQALGSVRLEDGQPVAFGASDAIGVGLRGPGGDEARRQLTVRRTPGGLAVEERRARPE